MIPHQASFLGKDKMPIFDGISGSVIRTKAIRRQIGQDKGDRQFMGSINAPPWTPGTPTEMKQPTLLVSAAKPVSTREQTIAETHNRRGSTDRPTLTTSAATTNSNKHTSSTRGNRCLTKGNSPGKPFKETTVAITQGTPTRRDHATQWSKATTKIKPNGHNLYNDLRTNNHQRQGWQGELKHWPTNGSQHRRTRQEEGNIGNETQNWTPGFFRRLPWSRHQRSHTWTASDNHRIKIGVDRKRRNGQSTNRGQRIHWTNPGCRHNLSKHANFLHTSNLANNS